MAAADVPPARRLPADALALAGTGAVEAGRRPGRRRHGPDRLTARPHPARHDARGRRQALAGLADVGWRRRPGFHEPRVRLDGELSKAPRPRDERRGHAGQIACRHLLAGQLTRFVHGVDVVQRPAWPGPPPGLWVVGLVRVCRPGTVSRAAGQARHDGLRVQIPLHGLLLHRGSAPHARDRPQPAALPVADRRPCPLGESPAGARAQLQAHGGRPPDRPRRPRRPRPRLP